MPIKRMLILVIICLFINEIDAQNAKKVEASICVQHAYTYRHLIGARVVIQELDKNERIMQSDSMTSAVSILAELEVNHRYRIRVEKAGFHTQDTVITPKIHSLSNKQRLGIFLKPVHCYYVRGYVYNINTAQKIRTGNIIVQDLSNQETKEIKIEEGYYEFCGRCGRQYQIKTTIDEHLDLNQTIDLGANGCNVPRDQTKRVNLNVFKNYEADFFAGKPKTLHDMTFVGETITLSAQGERAMQQLVLVLKQQPELRFSISIEAQPFAERRFNRMIAEKRARFIDRKLIQEGIGEHRYLLVCSEKVKVTSPKDNKKQKISLWLKM